MNVQEWQALADAYAFIGNSLLRPMTQTAEVGLSPAFWDAFPTLGSEEVARATNGLSQWAAEPSAQGQERTAQDAAVEYTALFVGPPSPAAPPWETMNRCNDVSAGFGEPTFQMREVLRSLGLQAAGPSNQYEDHMGIELLCLSEMCRRRAWLLNVAEAAPGAAPGGEAVGGEDSESQAPCALTDETVGAFIDEHPLGWIDMLQAKVATASPEGYFDHVLALAHALLAFHREQLA